jgi:hypothetical protein
VPAKTTDPLTDRIAERARGFSLRDAAALLGKSLPTLERWVSSGCHGVRLKTSWFAGRRFVTRQQLDDFLAAVEEARNAD